MVAEKLHPTFPLTQYESPTGLDNDQSLSETQVSILRYFVSADKIPWTDGHDLLAKTRSDRGLDYSA